MMKDMYSFDKSREEALTTYAEVIAAYKRVFAALELPVAVAAADSGLIGGDTTHEFHVVSPTGEDTLLFCDACEYVANVEKAKGVPLNFERLQQESRWLLPLLRVAPNLDALVRVRTVFARLSLRPVTKLWSFPLHSSRTLPGMERPRGRYESDMSSRTER